MGDKMNGNLEQLMNQWKYILEEEHDSFVESKKTKEDLKKYIINNIDDSKKQVEDSVYNPNGNTDLYVADLTWLINARDCNNNPLCDKLKLFGIVQGYKNAADDMVSIGKTMPDAYFYPIMFCYMQYLELVLKALILKTDINSSVIQTHNILELWDKFKKLIIAEDGSVNESKNIYKYSGEEIQLIDTIVNGLFSKNNSSMSFRYLQDLKDQNYLEVGYKVDLAVVNCWIDILDDLFYPVYNGE